METTYLVAILGIASAAAFGTADFCGGLSTKSAPVFGVLTIARACGLATMLTLARAEHEPIPSGSSVLWACAAGVAGGLALPALYRALALGKMGIAAPVTSVLSAGLPVLLSAVMDGMPRTLQIVGLAVAIMALWLISRPEGKLRPEGLGLAIFAGLGFGLFLIFMRQATAAVTYWPLAFALATSLAVALIFLLARGDALPSLRRLPVVIASGVLDSFGNYLFILASQRGRLDVAAVLSSLYPAATVLLARFVLRERIPRLQLAGLLAALMAVPLIAAR
jgi:drug/metabolite transporter (DMT)-like permease